MVPPTGERLELLAVDPQNSAWDYVQSEIRDRNPDRHRSLLGVPGGVD
jgi:hypothetical protein